MDFNFFDLMPQNQQEYTLICKGIQFVLWKLFDKKAIILLPPLPEDEINWEE
jgi:hypothetical protein